MENQSMTPTTEKTPEQIEREMLQTRESLTEKVSALESQVVGTVQTAAETLTGTMEAVKELMTSAPGAVSDTVKQAASAVSETMRKTFDISGRIREHPWAAVGVSTGLGFLTGLLIFRDRGAACSAPPAPVPLASPTPSKSHPGVFDELFGMIGRKVREVSETVIDSATAAVNQNIRDSVPKLVDAAIGRRSDDLDPARPTDNGYHG